MRRLLNHLLFICTAFVLCTTTVNCTYIDDLDLSILGEISSSVKESIREAIYQQYLNDINIVDIAKHEIYTYYNRTTFEEPEWIRVKNFLTWMDQNKDTLNNNFVFYMFYSKDSVYFYKLSIADKKNIIGSYLGANYITNNVLNQNFELQILLKNVCRTYKYGGICIYAKDIVSAINSAIHETTHMLLVNNKYFIGKKTEKPDILSEKATIFSQLKYALPLKINDENLLSGARANFRVANENFLRRYLDHLFREYVEFVPATTEYSEYSNNLTSILNLRCTEAMSVDDFLRRILSYKALAEYGYNTELTDIEADFIKNNVYKDTIDEVYDSIYADDLAKLKTKSEEEIYMESFILFEDNRLPIAKILFKNLKKYADPNIPPVPKGYI